MKNFVATILFSLLAFGMASAQDVANDKHDSDVFANVEEMPTFGDGGVEQFFHLLDAVRQTRGCCYTEEGALEFTRYSSCCDTLKRRYCYVTDTNRRITAIAMDQENLEGTALLRWKLLENEDILLQN